MTTELSPYRMLRDPEEVSPYGPYPSEHVESSQEYVRRYVRVLRKHYRLIVGVLTLFLGATAIVTLSTPRLYRAAATIQIERQAPRMAPTQMQEVDPIDAVEYDKYDYYQTQFEILKSRGVAARV